MSRPASRRTPAHERAVREGRLAQHEAHTLGAKLHVANEANAIQRQMLEGLSAELATQKRIKEQYAADLTERARAVHEGVLVSGEDWITLCDRLGLPAVPLDRSKTVTQVLDAVATAVARIERVTIERDEFAERAEALRVEALAPIPLRLPCPRCGTLHIDENEWATREHSTHTCQHCGECWKPCLHPTVGVRFLPGTKNEATS